MIKDLALDEMWEAPRGDKGYQSVAATIKKKMEREVVKTVSKAAIQEYTGHGVDRMSVIEKAILSPELVFNMKPPFKPILAC